VDHESSELIERQMEQTRESLTEKVALLEQQVVGTIQSATEAVQDTVQSVRSAVEDTVSSVSGTVKSSVESMKESLDMQKQVREHPWMMVGCAAATGFITGLLIPKRIGSSTSVSSSPAMPAAAFTPRAEISHRPQWLNDIFDMAGREIKKLAEQAVLTASAALKEKVATRLPQMLDECQSHRSSDRNGVARDDYPQPAI